MPWLCLLAVILLTSGQVLHADDPTAPADKDKVVPIKSGDSTAVIKVRDADPYKNLHVPPPSGKYDPTKYSMNQTSSLAGKSFTSDSIAVSKNGASTFHDQTAFATKTYSPNAMTAQNLDTKYATPTTSEANHKDSFFYKDYPTPSSPLGHDSSKSFNSTSPDQDRTATLGGKKSDVFDSGLSKQYLGPGAQHVPDGFMKENEVIAHVSDIPNRPLTIDEVRGLINHGFKPDLNSAASNESSKALNDPNYKPEASPEPPETSAPASGSPTEDDKGGELVPSPGTMAQPPPENSVPLPQH